MGNEDDTETRDERVQSLGRFRVRIHGDCMSPRWLAGELIEFVIWRGEELPIGEDCYFQRVDGTATFKTFLAADEINYTLAPRNPTHTERIIVPLQEVVKIAVAERVLIVRPK